MPTAPSIACVQIPWLPIVAHHGVGAANAERPRAVHRGRGTAARITFRDRVAAAAGVRVGQTLAAARARAADLDSRLFEPERMAEARRGLVARLLHHTPRVAAAGPIRFWAEPVAEPRRWAAAVRADAIHATTAPDADVAVGVGHSATVAQVAAFLSPGGVRVVADAEARAFIDAAPLEALALGSETLDRLASIGVRRIGELRALDPASLGHRFGPDLARARRRLDDDARGPSHPRPTPPRSVVVDTGDPVARIEPLLFLLAPAVERLLRSVRADERGVTSARLTLRTEREPVEVDIRAGAPVRESNVLFEMLRARLDGVRLPAPVSAFALEVRHEVAAPAVTEPLFAHARRREPGASEVALERVRARFGDDAVVRAVPRADPHPLARARWLRAQGALERVDERAAGLSPSPDPNLPWRRVDPPAPLRAGAVVLAGRRRRLVHLGRVERVAARWWEDDDRPELLAWAELEGPILALLHARCAAEDDEWSLIGWLD